MTRQVLRPLLDKDRYNAAMAILREATTHTPGSPYQTAWEMAAVRGVIPDSWMAHSRRFLAPRGYGSKQGRPYPRTNAMFFWACADPEGIEAAELIDAAQAPVWRSHSGVGAELNTETPFGANVVNPLQLERIYNDLLLEYKRAVGKTDKGAVAVRPTVLALNGLYTIAREAYMQEYEPTHPAIQDVSRRAGVWKLGYVPMSQEHTFGVLLAGEQVFR